MDDDISLRARDEFHLPCPLTRKGAILVKNLPAELSKVKIFQGRENSKGENGYGSLALAARWAYLKPRASLYWSPLRAAVSPRRGRLRAGTFSRPSPLSDIADRSSSVPSWTSRCARARSRRPRELEKTQSS